MLREQKTAEADYRYESMLETKSNNGVRSMVALETAEKDGANKLLEEILHRDNLNAAYLRVKKNIRKNCWQAYEVVGINPNQ